jgi:hypothetical protein
VVCHIGSVSPPLGAVLTLISPKSPLRAAWLLQEAYARRGAHWTFDGEGFVRCVQSVLTQPEVLAPSFDHGVGDPVEGDIRIASHHRCGRGQSGLIGPFPILFHRLPRMLCLCAHPLPSPAFSLQDCVGRGELRPA